MMMIKLPREDKQTIVKHVQAFFADERSEMIGDLGAEQIVDFMIGELGPYLYNQAIADARKLVQEKASQMEDELYALEKPTVNRHGGR